MRKLSAALGGGTLTLFIAYAATASTLNNPINPPCFLIVLLVVTALAAIGFIVTGAICIYRGTWGKKLEIDIHDSQSQSTIDISGEGEYEFKIYFNLKTTYPPTKIGRVRLFVQGVELESTEALPELTNDSWQSCSSTFASSEYGMINRPLKLGDRFHLAIFAMKKEWESREFELERWGTTYNIQLP